jgi:hypothetical protein
LEPQVQFPAAAVAVDILLLELHQKPVVRAVPDKLR